MPSQASASGEWIAIGERAHRVLALDAPGVSLCIDVIDGEQGWLWQVYAVGASSTARHGWAPTIATARAEAERAAAQMRLEIEDERADGDAPRWRA